MSSVTHLAPFTLMRKPTSNYTLTEAQYHFSVVGKNAGSTCISYTKTLNYRYIMKLEKNCYEFYGF